MVNIFEPLVDLQDKKLKSANWYKSAASLIADRATQTKLMRDGKLNARPSAGRMSMFIYDPKTKQKLPFYDTFPLVLPLETYSDGFLGINMHYLPIPLRIRLLDRLVDFSNDTDFDEATRLIVEYKKVKNIRLVKPTIHKYLAGQVKSQFRRIDADEFMIATLLPVQRFKKSTAKAVWSDSRSMV